MGKHKSFFGRSASIITLAVAAAGVAASAHAQAGASSEEIVVTGSHLGKSAFNSPTPVNVIGDERVKALAQPVLADVLNQLPSFRAFTSPTSNLFRVNGNIGARAMDLRGLGPTRTLTLLDGRRIVPSSDNGTVDMSGIPSSLVKRAEIVTGGASAAYGADAVSGVVNIILDNQFTGFKTDMSAGIAEENGDDQTYFASAAYGADFASGKGHVILGVEAQKERGITLCRKRDFCNEHRNFPGNPFYIGGKSTDGRPAILTQPADFLYSVNPNIIGYSVGATAKGQLPASAVQMDPRLKNKALDKNGNLIDFPYGPDNTGIFARSTPQNRDDFYGYGGPLITPTKHFSSLAHVDYDLTDSITATGEIGFSSVVGRAWGGYPIFANTAVKITNPFLPASTVAALQAIEPGITQINLNVAHPEAGQGADGTTYNDTWRGVFALKGDLWKERNVNWDASFTQGVTTGQLKVQRVRLNGFDGSGGGYNAIDAVTPPAGYTGPIYKTPDGRPVICNASIADPTNGCVPVNFPTPGGLTPDVIAKYWKSAWAKRQEKLQAYAANLRGDIFELPAGPIAAAVGAEWRQEDAVGGVDSITSSTGSGAFQGTQWTALPAVRRIVKEAYVEASIPLLKDMPFVKNLTIDGARRWTRYSTTGDANTWKAGGVYEPNDQIMVRVTQSSDIRAPTAAELNPNISRFQSPIPDQFRTDGITTTNAFLVSGGNPNLKNELAVTKTAGLVLKPSFLPGFRFSGDYYNIKVAGAIDSIPAGTSTNNCKSQNLACDLITFAGAFKASPLLEIRQNLQNLNKLHAEGAEFVFNYNFDALGGNFDATLNANYVIDLSSISALGVKTHFDNLTGNAISVTNVTGVPTYKLDGVVTFTRNNWSITAHPRYIPEAKLESAWIGPEDAGYNINLSNSVQTNRVKPAAYLDLSGTYSPTATIFGGKMQIYGAVNNVFNKQPPSPLRFFGNGIHYDMPGRYFRLGVRSNW